MKSEKEKEDSDSKNKVSFKAAIDLDMELVLAGEVNCTKKYGGEPKSETIDIETGIETRNKTGSTRGSKKVKSATGGAAEIAAVGKMGLTGIVKVEFRHSNSFFEVHAAAGAGLAFTAKGGGSTELALKLILEISDGEPDFKGELEFKGLVLSFMSFATVSIDKAETGNDIKQDSVNEDDDDLEGNDGKQEKLKEEMNMKDLKEIWTIFEPKKLPFWEN